MAGRKCRYQGGHDRHGHDPVGQLEEGEGDHEGGSASLHAVGQDEDDGEPDLIDDHVEQCPGREPAHLGHDGVAEVDAQADASGQAADEGPLRHGHEGHAGGGADGQQHLAPELGADGGVGGRAVDDSREGQAGGDGDEVVEDGGEHGHGEAVVGVEEGTGDGGQAVERHLRGKDA